jgi:hypothetical protein
MKKPAHVGTSKSLSPCSCALGRWQPRKASFAERRDAFDLIGLDQRGHRCWERALVVDAAGDHVLRQQPDVSIGHVGHLHSNSRIQHLAGDMIAGPGASARAVLELVHAGDGGPLDLIARRTRNL